MSPDRLKQIEKIYHAALEFPSDKRLSVIEEMCGGDAELRSEVETLLSFERTSENILDLLPTSFIKEVISESPSHQTNLINQIIGHYKIKALLGKGGMGEVYLAEDIKLNRKVAIKLLPESVSNDKNRLRRFEREALAASALNHPNILTIYEFGEEKETHFLATEFVDGVNLRELLNRKKLSLKEIINIAEQTASALSVAHKAGIVHRDIKPENIMLREDGLVKVLDFGLAKLIGIQSAEIPSLNPSGLKKSGSKTQFSTSGILLGTVAYMSPEQTRGRNVDERSDIWSLGVVIYEMLTGKTPFIGDSSGEIINAILLGDYLPVSKEVSPELEKIVEKCFQRKPENRYQKVSELLVDLSDFKEELSFQTKLEHSGSPHSTDELPFKHTNPDRTDFITKDSNIEILTPKINESSQSFLGNIKSFNQWILGMTVGVVLILISGTVYLGYQYFNSRSKLIKIVSEPMRQTRLTNLGRIFDAVISPNGQFLAYVIKDGAKYSLQVRDNSINSTSTIVPESEIVCWQINFSPDSKYIYFLQSDGKKTVLNDLVQIETIGGTLTKLIHDVDSKVSFSPDGRQIAYRRDSNTAKESGIYIANADGTNERQVAIRQMPETFVSGPAWSPDGQTLATFIKGKDDDGNEKFWLASINIVSGEQKLITQEKWNWIRDVKWMPDGKELIVNAHTVSGTPFPILRVAYPTGEVQNITHDDNDYQNISITADGKTFVTMKNTQTSNIYAAPIDDLKNAHQLTFLDGVTFYGFSWTPDKRIVYNSNVTGSFNLWIMDADGNNQKQITNDKFDNDELVVSPDGRYIVVASYRSGKFNLWRMNLDGSNPVQLTNGAVETYPVVTADNKWVIYVSNSPPEKITVVWKVPIDGGEPVKLTDNECNFPTVSPDGKWIACKYWDGTDSPRFLAIIPITGGEPVKKFNVNTAESWKFTKDSRGLIYMDKSAGYVKFFQLSLNSGKSKQITEFKSDQISKFEISPDGKQVVFLRGENKRDAIMISNFR